MTSLEPNVLLVFISVLFEMLQEKHTSHSFIPIG
jgi:hypothetical protein